MGSLSDIPHGFTLASGEDYEVVVTKALTFRCYDVPGLDKFEVYAAEGIVGANWHELPIELTPYQAAAVSALLLEAIS